jgi:hypothetical protein
MNRRTTFTLTAMTTLGLMIGLPIGNAAAQEKQHVSFSTPAETTKYTEKTESLDLGDVPNHILRVFEIHRTYADNAPVINGAKLAESWTRGVGERIDGTGTNLQYVVFIMDNGDKAFARMDGFATNDSGKIGLIISGLITGGTGRLATIRGLVREVVNFDPKTNLNENQVNIEYTVAK